MRLIDVDVLKEIFSRMTLTITGVRSGKTVLQEILIKYRDCVLRTIDEAPTVDAEPVKHGRWDADGYCTVCKREAIRLWANCLHMRTDYCHHCGAKMDLEEGE